MTTIRQVADKANVSPTTVSHVINQTRFVAPETEERVRKAMLDLNYSPNIIARSLRRGETKTIGLIIPDSANPFFAEYARYLEESAFHMGYSLILCNSNDNIEKEHRYTDVLLNKQVDGIIFLPTGDDKQSVQTLINRHMPVVLVDRILENIDVDAVITNNYQSGYLATRYLIENGHKRISIIRGPAEISLSVQRLKGYMKAMKEAGLDVSPGMQTSGDFQIESGYEAAKILMNQSPLPTAIFACNDLMAIGAMKGVREAGFLVPGDISLVGHDNIELTTYFQPALTTISQPIEELACKAIDLLLERIKQPDLPARQVVLPNKLVIRQSTRRIA